MDREIILKNISKCYDGKPVFRHYSLRMKPGGIYCLMGASGIGKTTLLRILMGLEEPDDSGHGSSSPGGFWKSHQSAESRLRISAVFQEDRLFEFANAVKNVELAAGRAELLFSPRELLGELLEQDALEKPVRSLSGGMRRRVAVARALAAPSELLVMDEPFTGLDEATRKKVIEVILKYRAGRTLLVVTHQAEDAVHLGGEMIRLEKSVRQST